MKDILKKLPIPVVGLMLALAATGNLVLSYGKTYRDIFGLLSSLLFILVILKIIMYPKTVFESMNNPVVASVFPTFSMGIMLLATYLKPYQGRLASIMWTLGLILHIVLILYFTKKYILNLNIKQVFPSWFIVYVGIVVGSITGPAFEKSNIGQILFGLV